MNQKTLRSSIFFHFLRIAEGTTFSLRLLWWPTLLHSYIPASFHFISQPELGKIFTWIWLCCPFQYLQMASYSPQDKFYTLNITLKALHYLDLTIPLILSYSKFQLCCSSLQNQLSNPFVVSGTSHILPVMLCAPNNHLGKIPML